MTTTGACLCRALCYESSAEPIESGYCHCRMCQRSSGAPVLAWTSFAAHAFRYVRGSPTIYQSSDNGHREFCANCGTQIAFRDSTDPAHVYINVGSLDDPAGISPSYHIWCESQLPWFEIDDDLPRYDTDPDSANS